jgi:hypothetical protein
MARPAAPPDASAAAGGGMAGDRVGARRGAAGEHPHDLRGEALAQVRVRDQPWLGVAFGPGSS